MTSVKASHDALASKVTTVANNMGLFKTDVQTTLDMINGPEGMISRLNCKFLGDNL